MTPLAVDIGIFVYEYLKIIVAVIAVALAVTWKKNEFLAGLFFFLLYTLFDAMSIFLSDIIGKPFLEVSQFGFILLAIVSFILGMWQSVKAGPGSAGGVTLP